MLYPKGPEKKLFTLGPKPSGARECFSRGSDSGNGPSLGGDSISCSQEEKNTKILSIRHWLRNGRLGVGLK